MSSINLYGIVAAVCCFLCYFMAHEHLLKEHTYLHVASAFPLRETIDFTGFCGTFQDTAVAHEKYF